jgi:protein-disulfide isomerase
MSENKRTSTTERAAAALRQQEAIERRRRFAMVGSVIAVLVIIGGATWFAISRGDTTGETVAASDTPANTDGYAVVVGDAAAPTTLTFYEDPQCPACQQFESTVNADVNRGISDGNVKVEYRIVSFLDQASTNDYSSRAANALFVVADTAGPEAFKKFHDLLYENQPAEGSAGPDDDQLIAWAVEAGADEAAVRAKIEDEAFGQYVVNATDQWSKDGYNGTPTVLVDGKTSDDPVNDVMAALQ